MCRGTDLPICQKALVGCTKCLSTVTDSLDRATTVTAPDLNSASSADSQKHNSVEPSVNKKFRLKKLHSRVLDSAAVVSETKALKKVVQAESEADRFGIIREKVETLSKERKLHRSKVVEGRSGKPLENVGNTEMLSSSAQEWDGVLHDGDSQRDSEISEADIFGTLSDGKEDNIELIDADPVV